MGDGQTLVRDRPGQCVMDAGWGWVPLGCGLWHPYGYSGAGPVNLEALTSVEPALGVMGRPWLWYEGCSGSSLFPEDSNVGKVYEKVVMSRLSAGWTPHP